jgi:lipopolysaccharide transport system permease protein
MSMSSGTEARPRGRPRGTGDGLPDSEKPTTVIRPTTGWVGLKLGDVWRFRELVGFLAWRDLSVRYRQTAIGILWAVVQPFFTMVVFSVVFGHLAGLKSGGLPYPLFAFAALVPWQFFVYCLNQSGTSLIANQNLITKVYFPRLVIPISVTLAGLADFLIASVVLGAMMGYYGVAPTAAVALLPAFVLLALVTALGVGLILSSLAVRYRDVQYVIPFLVQIWLFATPIAYEPAIFPQPWRSLLGLNPMTGVVEGFRWALLGAHTAPGTSIVLSAVVACGLLVVGMFTFRRMEAFFADRI